MHAHDATLAKVIYRPPIHTRKNVAQSSINVVGIDTEAYTTGKCFMVATSRGDVWHPVDVPWVFFSREYRGTNFVAYNLKYDSGAFLQHLPKLLLNDLRNDKKVMLDGFAYRAIGNKCLTISRGKNSIHIYDMLNFYNMSLQAAAEKYLGKSKLDIETKSFAPDYVKSHWESIASYCVQDAVLVKDLAELLLRQFEEYGVYARKLYSVAYVSWQYFRARCPYVHVKRYWDSERKVLDYAMQAYNGGKFEVTRKGADMYYSYDIVSAYPYEIANLINILDARVVYSKRVYKSATYGFLDCTMRIPYHVYSPVAVKRGMTNTFPVGEIHKVITYEEYKYLIAQGCDITIHDAAWLICDKRDKPYHDEVLRFMKYKDYYKLQGDKVRYHTVKILLNAFYGKFCQLIWDGKYYRAGAAWNPVYASYITANTRIRISNMQQQHPSVVAVHTDSVISTAPLPYAVEGKLGDVIAETQGQGIILGSGVYQIGDKSKARGFALKTPLIQQIPKRGRKMRVDIVRPYTWREVAHRNLGIEYINRFEKQVRALDVNFDAKRLWLNDYRSFSDVFTRCVDSAPLTPIPGVKS